MPHYQAMPTKSISAGRPVEADIGELVRKRLGRLHADAIAVAAASGSALVATRLRLYATALLKSAQVAEKYAHSLTRDQLDCWQRSNDLQLVADLGVCALAAGDDALAFPILRGVGQLTGGEAGAALEIGLALAHVRRYTEAIDDLLIYEEKAGATDGTAASVLATLMYDRADHRWRGVAHRVLATSTNPEARRTCANIFDLETTARS